MASNTYVALSTQTLGSAVSSVTFSSIASGYTDLVLVVSGRSSNAAADDSMYIQLNGDTAGTNYSFTRVLGNGTAASAYEIANQIRTTVDGIAGGTTASGTFGVATVNFQNYSNTNVYKTILSRSGIAGSYTLAAVGLWRNTAAINTILLTLASGSNWAVGSTFTLYGIAAASIGAKATGGTIYQDSTYFYHVFSGNGTFTPASSLTADVLVVAGGGGGSASTGAGGGAGGLLYFASQSLTATGYTCTVGAGGASGGTSSRGAVGGDSQFAALTLVKGGGYGGNSVTTTGGTGGSGGGGGGASGSGGSPTSGQGFAGGASVASQTGGGGGAGGAAPAGSTGSGGVGLSTYSSWGVATGIGQNVSDTYYLAGGGSGWGNLAGNVGGYGGGGNPEVSGTSSSGGGGGAYKGVTSAGAGGSGVIIVRYAK